MKVSVEFTETELLGLELVAKQEGLTATAILKKSLLLYIELKKKQALGYDLLSHKNGSYTEYTEF